METPVHQLFTVNSVMQFNSHQVSFNLFPEYVKLCQAQLPTAISLSEEAKEHFEVRETLM